MFTFLQIREKNSRGWDFLAVESHQKDSVVEQNVKRLKKNSFFKNEFLLLLSKEVRDSRLLYSNSNESQCRN